MIKPSVVALACVLGLSGCATHSLLNSHTSARTEKITLIEDAVMAFGRPAATAGLSADSLVIIGEKHSYLLSDGGARFAQFLGALDPKNISVENDLAFYSEKNDGHFSGELKLSYAKLKDEIQREDLQFFLQNDVKECTTSSDERMGAQRFCANIKIKGVVYPQASNYQLLRSQFSQLTRPYQVSIYTTKQTATKNKYSTGDKLVLLPFALAFDVVTLPLQLLNQNR